MSRAVFNWVLKVIHQQLLWFGFSADNKQCKSCLCSQWHLDLCKCQDSMCSWLGPQGLGVHVVSHCQSFPRAYKCQAWGLYSGAVSPPLPAPTPLSAVVSMWQVPSFSLPCGDSWLGYQDLPFMGAVSIWELAANSENSTMHQAPNLHFSSQLMVILNRKLH